MTIKEAMIELHVYREISKYRIAKVMGMSPVMVDRFLAEGQTTMREDSAIQLKKRYNIDIDEKYLTAFKKEQFIGRNSQDDD